MSGTPPAVILEDVHLSFGGRPVFEGLDLEVPSGRTTVVAGQSGAGKSLLLKLVMGLVRPQAGRVIVFGTEIGRISELELSRLRARMGMVFQNYALLDSLTVAENVGFWLRENTKRGSADIARAVEEILARFDLTDAAGKVPAELSGGMRKRASLARALIAEPDLLLIDEPTTGLDPVMTERVTGMLLDIKRSFSLTGLIVSHDMGSATRFADQIAVLGERRVVARGDVAALRAAAHPLVHAFFEGAEPGQALVAAEVQAHEAAPPPVIELRDVHRAFGAHEVLRGVDLAIRPRAITVIIGGSGSGKSVIVKHVMGLLRPDRGSILLFGEESVGFGERELESRRARIGMLFQGAALLDSLTVAENVAFPLVERMGMRRRAARRLVSEMLERVHVPEIAERFPSEISNGQRKRVGLARALVTKPEVIIYDEPTTGQDPVMTRYVDDMIVEAQAEFDVTSVVISHDMPSAFRIGHVIAMLHEGRIIAVGTPAELAASEDARVRSFIHAGRPEGLTTERGFG